MKDDFTTNEVENLASFGGVFKESKAGGRLIAYGSVTINKEALLYVSTLSAIRGLLFYCCSFDDVDFSVLSSLKVSDVSVLHGSFGDSELQQLKRLPSLRTLKLYDTKVTHQELDNLIAYNPYLELL